MDQRRSSTDNWSRSGDLRAAEDNQSEEKHNSRCEDAGWKRPVGFLGDHKGLNVRAVPADFFERVFAS